MWNIIAQDFGQYKRVTNWREINVKNTQYRKRLSATVHHFEIFMTFISTAFIGTGPEIG